MKYKITTTVSFDGQPDRQVTEQDETMSARIIFEVVAE